MISVVAVAYVESHNSSDTVVQTRSRVEGGYLCHSLSTNSDPCLYNRVSLLD
jgi:hypothetical protein